MGKCTCIHQATTPKENSINLTTTKNRQAWPTKSETVKQDFQDLSTRLHYLSDIPNRPDNTQESLTDTNTKSSLMTTIPAWKLYFPTRYQHLIKPSRLPQNEQPIWQTWRPGTHHDGTLQRFITKCSWTKQRNKWQSFWLATGGSNTSNWTLDSIHKSDSDHPLHGKQ